MFIWRIWHKSTGVSNFARHAFARCGCGTSGTLPLRRQDDCIPSSTDKYEYISCLPIYVSPIVMMMMIGGLIRRGCNMNIHNSAGIQSMQT